MQLGPFQAGLGSAIATAKQPGWTSLGVGPCFDGQGIEPFPQSVSFADGLSDLPSASSRAYPMIAGNRLYVGLGRRIYQSVALDNATWSAFTVAADLGAGFTISGLAYYQDDLLVLLSSGQDIRKLNTSTNASPSGAPARRGRSAAATRGNSSTRHC